MTKCSECVTSEQLLYSRIVCFGRVSDITGEIDDGVVQTSYSKVLLYHYKWLHNLKNLNGGLCGWVVECDGVVSQ